MVLVMVIVLKRRCWIVLAVHQVTLIAWLDCDTTDELQACSVVSTLQSRCGSMLLVVVPHASHHRCLALLGSARTWSASTRGRVRGGRRKVAIKGTVPRVPARSLLVLLPKHVRHSRSARGYARSATQLWPRSGTRRPGNVIASSASVLSDSTFARIVARRVRM